MNAADIARQHGGKPLSTGGFLCHCPVPSHGRGRGDKNPSLTIADGEKGLVVDCKCGCDPRAVLDALGYKPNGTNGSHFDFNKAARQGRQEKPQSEPEPFNDYPLTKAGYRQAAVYDYATPDGELLYQVVRYEHPIEEKTFLQRRPDGRGGWWKGAGSRKVLYRWPDFAKHGHTTAYVCEGEKDADRLASLGLLAVTVASGAWSQEAIEALKGYECLILEDNDKTGRDKAEKAAKALHGVAACVRIVRIPGLADGEDVSDWLDQGGDAKRLPEIAAAAPEWKPEEPATDDAPLKVSDWLKRDLPEPDFLLGELLSTTSRALLVAPTGLGKTMLFLTVAGCMSAGKDFLHWQTRRAAKILYIDGEMSRRLLKKRLADVVKRLGVTPETLFVLSHEDIPNFAPLNTPEGQAQVEAFIAKIGGVDFIIFDNIMSLVGGDQKDEEGWRQTLPWVRSLTRRSIGQLWIHHTGHDESRSYGTKTREWQMDTVMHLERVERADTDVSFTLSFRKARERTPDNRVEFQEVTVALVNDRWEHSGAAPASGKRPLSPMARKFFDAFGNVTNTTTFQNWKSVTSKDWQAECVVLGLIDKAAREDSARALFSKYRRELVAAGYVACNGDLTWRL